MINYQVSIEQHRKALGLTPEEALLYETLLVVGPSQVANVAVGLGVSPNSLYRHANNLVRKQFAVVRKGWPREFEAVPLAVALQQVERRNALSQTAARKSLLHQAVGLPAIPAATDVEILSGRQALYDRYVELAQTAHTEILAYTIGVAFSEKLHRTQTEVLAVGVEMRHIVQQYDRDNYHIIQKWRRLGAKMRYLPVPAGFHLMIFDNTTALVSLSNPAAVAAMRDYFYSLWAQAAVLH